MESFIIFSDELHCSIIDCEIFNFTFIHKGKAIMIPHCKAQLNWFNNQVNYLTFQYNNEDIFLSNECNRKRIPDNILSQAVEFFAKSNYKICKYCH